MPPDTEDIIIGERDSLADMIDDRAGGLDLDGKRSIQTAGRANPLGKGLSMLTSTW